MVRKVLRARVKRFSWIAFAAGSLVHLYGTSLLFAESMRYHLGGPAEPMLHATLLKISCYIWLPVPLLLRPLLGQGLNPDYVDYFPVVVLVWSFVVGAAVGLLMPRLVRWLRGSANHRNAGVARGGV